MAWIKGNFYLNKYQMQNNALIINNWLWNNDYRWADESVAALLGNMQQESTINPGIWQSLKPGSEGGGGWGLVQWTPWTNFTNWAKNNGYADDDGDAQLLWIRDMTVPFGQWIPTSSYNISFASWKINEMEKSVSWLATAFCKNFERGTMGDRVQYANEWFDWLLGNPDKPDEPPDPGPDDPDYPLPGDIRRKMPLYMYKLPWT